MLLLENMPSAVSHCAFALALLRSQFPAVVLGTVCTWGTVWCQITAELSGITACRAQSTQVLAPPVAWCAAVQPPPQLAGGARLTTPGHELPGLPVQQRRASSSSSSSSSSSRSRPCVDNEGRRSHCSCILGPSTASGGACCCPRVCRQCMGPTPPRVKGVQLSFWDPRRLKDVL